MSTFVSAFHRHVYPIHLSFKISIFTDAIRAGTLVLLISRSMLDLDLLLIYRLIYLISHLYINLACLSVSLSVCLYPINVKTAEPIGPKFFVGHLGTPGKVYKWSKFQIFVSIKIGSSLNFLKFWKSTNFVF